jgi:hypothetical protein
MHGHSQADNTTRLPAKHSGGSKLQASASVRLTQHSRTYSSAWSRGAYCCTSKLFVDTSPLGKCNTQGLPAHLKDLTWGVSKPDWEQSDPRKECSSPAGNPVDTSKLTIRSPYRRPGGARVSSNAESGRWSLMETPGRLTLDADASHMAHAHCPSADREWRTRVDASSTATVQQLTAYAANGVPGVVHTMHSRGH